jgi:hypothetical protein
MTVNLRLGLVYAALTPTAVLAFTHKNIQIINLTDDLMNCGVIVVDGPPSGEEAQEIKSKWGYTDEQLALVLDAIETLRQESL